MRTRVTFLGCLQRAEERGARNQLCAHSDTRRQLLLRSGARLMKHENICGNGHQRRRHPGVPNRRTHAGLDLVGSTSLVRNGTTKTLVRIAGGDIVGGSRPIARVSAYFLQCGFA
jgi:hypothetical protein